MKIELKDSCFGDTLYVNDTEFSEMSVNDRVDIIKYLLDVFVKQSNNIDYYLKDWLREIIWELGTPGETYYCEQCGDSSTDYTLIINEGN